MRKVPPIRDKATSETERKRLRIQKFVADGCAGGWLHDSQDRMGATVLCGAGSPFPATHDTMLARHRSGVNGKNCDPHGPFCNPECSSAANVFHTGARWNRGTSSNSKWISGTAQDEVAD
jgi:hypothetical protein